MATMTAAVIRNDGLPDSTMTDAAKNYVIHFRRALNVTAMDSNGKSDPYVCQW